MKRFLVVICILTVFLGVSLHFAPKPFARLVAMFPQDAQVVVCCRRADCPATSVGCGYLVCGSLAEFATLAAACHGVDGISVSFRGTADDFAYWQQRLQLSVADTRTLGSLTVVCGKSKLVCGKVVADGAELNVQMAFDGQTVTIGSPLILCGY